ncbi:MAG: hypothetical protein PHG00_07695 [Methylococcales bacterium]|nr:hypothetical protein [Methylococcales bacterium]
MIAKQDPQGCRVDKRSAPTLTAQNLVDAYCFSTLPLPLFAARQNISLHTKITLKEGKLPQDSVVKEFLTTAAHGKCVGWVEQCETQRQGLASLGFIAFNPAYVSLWETSR